MKQVYRMGRSASTRAGALSTFSTLSTSKMRPSSQTKESGFTPPSF